ncbi:MAG: hypothetical protein KGZ92_01140 [Firmicutes bacterium]|nr:hypothetical protein [Dethiobacter sp.]MBS3887890.1 hypothetical protein [Bacillota bacterium]MBS4053864.1 hypothetical protein [Thermaerobacter sp.]
MGEVRVSVRGHVVKYFPGEAERFVVTIEEPLAIVDLLRQLKVDPLLIMMVHVNGRKEPKSSLIHPGDEVLFFSPPAGG